MKMSNALIKCRLEDVARQREGSVAGTADEVREMILAKESHAEVICWRKLQETHLSIMKAIWTQPFRFTVACCRVFSHIAGKARSKHVQLVALELCARLLEVEKLFFDRVAI